MGELEDKSLSKRTAIGEGGSIARTGGTYFDPEYKVDVYAPGGQYFVEYDTGRVELKPIGEGGKIPTVQELLNPGATAGKPLGSSSPGDLGAGDPLNTPFKLGDLEQQAFDERSSLGVSGDPSRVGATFFDPRRGVDVQAPPGKYYVEYAGGGVELRDIPPDGKIPTFDQLFAGATPAKPVGESTPGEGSTGVDSLKIPSIGGKEVSRTGATFFDEQRGIDVQAEDGFIFVEYADGTVEQRRITDIQTPGEAKQKTEFGPSFEELGLNADGSQKGAAVDNSGLEYIGKTYTVAEGKDKGTVRNAPEGQAYYQDPKTRTILLRPDTGAENALPSTSPSVAADRGDMKTVFRAVFGRDPSQSELQYWNGRTDKRGASLIGAMQFAKQSGKTIGDAAGEPGGGTAAINSGLNATQQSDLASIGAFTTGKDLTTKSQSVIDKILGDIEAPKTESLAEFTKEQLAGSQMQEAVNNLNKSKNALRTLDADYATAIEQEETRQVGMAAVRRRQDAVTLDYNRTRRDLVAELNAYSDIVQSQTAIMGLMIDAFKFDQQQAQVEYTNKFNKAMAMYNVFTQEREFEFSVQKEHRDTQRANLSVLTGLISEGRINYNNLSPDAKAQISAMEQATGLVGVTQAIAKTPIPPVVSMGSPITAADGSVYTPIYSQDPLTGKVSISQYKHPYKERVPGGGGGTDASTLAALLGAVTAGQQQTTGGGEWSLKGGGSQGSGVLSSPPMSAVPGTKMEYPAGSGVVWEANNNGVWE